MKQVFYFFLFCLLLPPICYAENGDTTTRQIKEACESTSSTANQSLCLGFINGVVQTYLGMQNLTTVYKNRVCLPYNVGLKDLREAFLENANNLDEKHLNTDADVALMSVLIEKFPCHAK